MARTAPYGRGSVSLSEAATIGRGYDANFCNLVLDRSNPCKQSSVNFVSFAQVFSTMGQDSRMCWDSGERADPCS